LLGKYQLNKPLNVLREKGEDITKMNLREMQFVDV
jgi:hypothetical protein